MNLIRFRTIWHILWLWLLNCFILQQFSKLHIGSRLINSSHSPIKFSQLANLTTYKILSLFILHIRSYPSSTICIFLITTALFGMHNFTCAISPFFILSTSFCSLSSWFTSSCTYHLITVPVLFSTSITHSAFHSRL